MPPLVFDFPDIRSRMLGDDKPKPISTAPRSDHPPLCSLCRDVGWVGIRTIPVGKPLAFKCCPRCFNPDNRPCP
jgi:hypothetical protein